MVRPSGAPKSKKSLSGSFDKAKTPRAEKHIGTHGTAIKKAKQKTPAAGELQVEATEEVAVGGDDAAEGVARRGPRRKPETLLKWGHRREVRASTESIIPLQLIRRLLHEMVATSFPGVRVAVSMSALQLCAYAGDALGTKLCAQARTFSVACRRHYTTGRDIQRAINFLSIA